MTNVKSIRNVDLFNDHFLFFPIHKLKNHNNAYIHSNPSEKSNYNEMKSNRSQRWEKLLRKWNNKNSLITISFNKSMSLITKSKSCKHSSHLSTHDSETFLCDNFYVKWSFWYITWFWLCVRARAPFLVFFVIFILCVCIAVVLPDFISL